VSARFGVSGKSLKWKPRYSREGTLFPNSIVRSQPTLHSLFSIKQMPCLEIQENPSSGRRGKAENVLCSPCKVNFSVVSAALKEYPPACSSMPYKPLQYRSYKYKILLCTNMHQNSAPLGVTILCGTKVQI
jgi:hypothetical protein